MRAEGISCRKPQAREGRGVCRHLSEILGVVVRVRRREEASWWSELETSGWYIM